MIVNWQNGFSDGVVRIWISLLDSLELQEVF